MGSACGSSKGEKLGTKGGINPSDRSTRIMETKILLQKKWSEELRAGSDVQLSSPWASTTSSESINLVYNLCDTIGEGFTGKVWKASLKGYPKKLFAIKSIRKSSSSDKNFKYFKGEVDLLKELDHPNIIRFFECYQDQKCYHLVLEYCEGSDLVKLVEKHKGLSEGLAKKFIFQAMLAINYLHTVGIVHRDVKLDNFLLNKADESVADIKLIDFGFARNFRGDKLYSQIGTPWYVAPEVLNKSSSYDQSCDVWSLGVLLYIMLYAEPPFKGNNNIEIFHQIADKKLDFTQSKYKNTNPEILELLSQLLQKNPAERTTITKALESKWFHSQIVEIHKNWGESTIKQVLQKLTSAKAESLFRREVVKVMVKIFYDSKEIKEAETLFYCCDYLNNGVITEMELEHLFQEVKMPCSQESLKQLIESLYLKTPGVLTFSEFLVGVLNKSFFTDHLRLKITFDRFDVDHSGYITEDNIKACFSRFGYNIRPDLVKDLIKDFDIYKDGVISYEEFVKVMKKD